LEEAESALLAAGEDTGEVAQRIRESRSEASKGIVELLAQGDLTYAAIAERMRISTAHVRTVKGRYSKLISKRKSKRAQSVANCSVPSA
jgi:DNA-directed RNA polymerase specialized sigma subunit